LLAIRSITLIAVMYKNAAGAKAFTERLAESSEVDAYSPCTYCLK
jgi:hypothetical protein